MRFQTQAIVCALRNHGEHGEHVQVVRGMADELLERIDRLGGLNEPHLILGKILARAYDVSAFKLAADDLLVQLRPECET